MAVIQELKTPSPLRVDPAKAAEERSYERAYNRAKKDAAQAKGAADGMADALQDSDALQRARQRALSADQPKPALPKVETPAKAQQFVQISARAKNYRVPDPQWYSLSPTEKSEYLDAVDGAEQKKADDSLALRSINELMDLLDRREAKARERDAAKDELIAALLTRVEALEGADRSHKVEASQELTEQLARTSEASIGAANVEASLRNQTAASWADHERMGVEAQSRIQAQEQPIARMEGKAASTMTLVQERSNAAVERVSIVESKVARADVRVTELGDRVDLITDLPSKAQLQEFIRAEVQRELSGQVTDDFVERVVKERFTVSAPTSNIDVMDRPNIEMVEGIANDSMERKAQAAIKRGGK